MAISTISKKVGLQCNCCGAYYDGYERIQVVDSGNADKIESKSYTNCIYCGEKNNLKAIMHNE